MITRIGLEQLLRIWDYLAFESDASMDAVRCVADLIWAELPLHPEVKLTHRQIYGEVIPADRSRGYEQFKEREGN